MFVLSTFDFGIEAAEGMAYLHSMQPPLLHRDLKTLNLMVTSDMKIKVGSVSLLLLCFFPSHHKQVGDFGLSIFDNATKKEGSVTGTAAYLAPETLEGVSFTLKSDVCTPSSLLSSLPTTFSLLLPSLTPPPSSHPPPTSPSSIANYTTTGLCFCCCLLGISQLDTETYVPEPVTKTKTKQKQNKNKTKTKQKQNKNKTKIIITLISEEYEAPYQEFHFSMDMQVITTHLTLLLLTSCTLFELQSHLFYTHAT